MHSKQCCFLCSAYRVTSDVACLETYANIKPLNLQPLISHRRLFPHQAELRLHWSISLASAFSTVFSQKRFALLLKTDIVTVHLPLASYAGVFRGTRLSSLPTRDERRAPPKTPAWEASGRCTVTWQYLFLITVQSACDWILSWMPKRDLSISEA